MRILNRSLRLPVISLVLISAAQTAAAVTISTSATCSLAQAIESANTNVAVGGCVAGAVGLDTVVVSMAETLSVANNGANGLPIVIEDLRIRSESGEMPIVQRDYVIGTPDFRLLEIGTMTDAPAVTISGIRMQHGRVSGPGAVGGGCIRLRNGTLTIADSIIEECVAKGEDDFGATGADAKGGAIEALGSELRIRNSSILLSDAIGGDVSTSGIPPGDGEGGGVYATNLTTFILENTTFASNRAFGGSGVDTVGVGKGGAVFIASPNGTFTGNDFLANAAAGGEASNGDSGAGLGGALYLAGTALTVSDSDISGNVAVGGASATGRGGYAYGGAIFASSSTLEVTETSVSDNRATAGTGSASSSDGIATGGGLHLLITTATINDSLIDTNSISGYSPSGAGIFFRNEGNPATSLRITGSTIAYNNAIATHGSAHGGGLYQVGESVTMRNVSLTDNNADEGGGLFQEYGTTVIKRSVFSNNAARDKGGAVAADSSNFAYSNNIELTNVTVTGNTAGTNGGGIYVKGAPAAPNQAAVSLNNATITNNNTGGIYLWQDLSEPVLESGNSIIGAQASGDDCTVNGTATFTSNGGNLESGTTCNFTNISDQQSVAALGLGDLGNHGGDTLNYELLPDSPAIDAGKKRTCNRIAKGRDQRGLARFYDGDGNRRFQCDSGATEYQGLLANPGFEERLNAGAAWSVSVSGGGDDRTRLADAPSGKFAFVFQANAAEESISQSLAVAGAADETYNLTLLAKAAGVTIGEGMSITLESMAGGAPLDTVSCDFAFPATDFIQPPPLCALTTTATYDGLSVTIGWEAATSGSLTIDAVSLTGGT